MSTYFYLEEEENKREESINYYSYLFESYEITPPTLAESLLEMYILSNITEEQANNLVNDILTKCQNRINIIEINNKYPNITKEDALIICSYTCEANNSNFSPYKILNKNFILENRQNGIRTISKYLFIFLRALRKLPRYYPDDNNRYLYRCINKQINYMIDPFDKKKIPYIMGREKTFWGFTSTTPDVKTSYDFLGQKKELKSGTIFTLCGDIWGYDITLFNYFHEEEIILEPERKFIVEQILPPVNEIINVRCKVENSPLILTKDETKGLILNNTDNKSIKKKEIKCKKGKSHEINKINGKCKNCDIVGCENDISEHSFSKITGKCNYCQISGCEKGLIEHSFNRISGKCNYCEILGCKNGLKEHNFNKYSGKCDYCQVIGCEEGLLEHNFNKYSEKCLYCQIIGCEKGFKEHNYNKYSGKCIYCGLINKNNT